MSGAYDLLGLKSGTGQLIRRAETIHMSRYDLGDQFASEDDLDPMPGDFDEAGFRLTGLDHFSQAMYALVEAAPVECEEGLFDDHAYYLMKSVGCVGNFRDWLDRGCVDALSGNAGLLSKQIMRRSAIPNWKLTRLTKEAMLGEVQMRDLADIELASLYKLASLEGIDPPQRQKPKRAGRVGKRGPSRDPVGGIHD